MCYLHRSIQFAIDNRGPLTWLTAWNYPGALPPKVWRQTRPEEDLDRRAERDVRLHAMGVRPTRNYIEATYGGEWEVVDAPPLGPDPGPRFAEPAVVARPPDAVDRAVAALDEDWEPLMTPLLAPIEALVAGATSLEEVRARLAEAARAMDAAAVAEHLGSLSAQAFLAGEAGVELIDGDA